MKPVLLGRDPVVPLEERVKRAVVVAGIADDVLRGQLAPAVLAEQVEMRPDLLRRAGGARLERTFSANS